MGFIELPYKKLIFHEYGLGKNGAEIINKFTLIFSLSINLIASIYSTTYKSYFSHSTPFEDGDTHKSLVLSDNLFRGVTSVHSVSPRHCFIGKGDL